VNNQCPNCGSFDTSSSNGSQGCGCVLILIGFIAGGGAAGSAMSQGGWLPTYSWGIPLLLIGVVVWVYGLFNERTSIDRTYTCNNCKYKF
jgi:hypothetical protein